METKALELFTYGVYLIGSAHAGRINVMTANSVFQVSSQPPMVAVCINKASLTHELVSYGKVTSISVLERDTPLQFIGRFGFWSGRQFNKLEGVNFKVGTTGAPIILEYSIAYIEISVNRSFDVGTHTIFIGRAIDARLLRDGEPLTYAYYRQVKGGRVPEHAPTFIGGSSAQSVNEWKRTSCR